MLKHFHFWHIVTLSPWPFVLSLSVISLPLGLVTFFQGYFNGLTLFFIGILVIIFIIFLWFRDIIIEGTFEGHHTKQVQASLIVGFILFIFSEVMFFVSFFWAFFHSSLFPNIELNLTWPPIGMEKLIFDPFGIPLLNTIILLLSGVTLTLGHLYLRKGYWFETIVSITATIFLAELFLCYQFMEYSLSPFDISDGIYGSTFYMCTGFHGLHVLIGFILLSVVGVRAILCHFSKNHHIGFITAAWYWHFVDVVWLFLYISIYYLGSEMVFQKLVEVNGYSELFITKNKKKILIFHNNILYWC